MKKLTHIFVALVVTFAAVLSLSACGKNPITSTTVSGLDLAVAKGATLDTSTVEVTAKYKKGESKTFSGDDLTFGSFSTDALGAQDLTITINPEDYTFTVSIRIVATEADVNAISQLESELVKEYNANRTATGDNENFAHDNEPIYVGDDNTFHFRLKAAGVAADGETLLDDVRDVRTIVTVEEKTGTTYTELTGAALDAKVSIDTINAQLNFTEAAIGKTYRITVVAANPDLDYEESNYSFTAEVEVIDGFNVYDTVDLSAFDNFNIKNGTFAGGDSDYTRVAGDGWTDYHTQVKARYNMTDADLENIKAFIFQDDIDLTAQNVREDFFWSADDPNYTAFENFSEYDQVLGTPHNISEYALFHREVANGVSLKMIGNYFSINASRIPLMTACDFEEPENSVNSNTDKGMTAYSALFRTEPKHGATITDANTKVEFRNMSFIGNGEMTPDCRVSGSLLLMKHDEINFYGYNTIANNFYMTYYFAYGNPNNPNEGNYVIEDCTAYNSYSSLIYTYGGERITIINSRFENSGGPAILAECVTENTDYSGITTPEQYRTGTLTLAPHIDLVGSTIVSKLSGQEGWFNTYPGSGALVQAMGLMDQALSATGKGSIIADHKTDGNNQVPRVNIQVALFGPGIVGNTETDLGGKVFVFDNMDQYKAHYGIGCTAESQVTGLDMSTSAARPFAIGGAPMFECHATGAYTDAVGVGISQDADNGWTSNNVNLHMHGGVEGSAGYMSLLLGFTPAPAEDPAA